MSEDLGTSENWGRPEDDPSWGEEEQSLPSSSRPSQLIETLSSVDDMGVLQALSQLSEELSMVQEDQITSYPLPQLIPILVQCLQRDSIPDLMLHAINCIINLIDILPNLTKIFVSSGAIPAICAKLTSFEFIDLAESAIKALEKLGHEHGQAILQEGILSALVELVYFFDVETQKRIMRVLTQLASAATNHELYVQFVEPALPSLLPHLNSDENSPLTELALQFFYVLIEAVGESGESPRSRTDSLCERGLLTSLVELLQTRLDLIGRVFEVLERLATTSAEVAESLLNFGIISSIAQSLRYEFKEADNIKEALGLINALLPETVRPLRALIPRAVPSLKKTTEDLQLRLDFFQGNPHFIDSLAELVIPRVLSSFDKIDHRSVKSKSLKAFDSLLILGTVDTLTALIDPVVFASFVQELLYSNDQGVLELSLSIVSTAYEKLPGQFIKRFAREGVHEKLKSLSKLHELMGEAAESSVLVQLSAVCAQLEEGEAALALEELKTILEGAEGVTSSEVFHSQLPISLFKWLSQDPANSNHLKAAWPPSTLSKLLKLLILSLKFTESLTIQVREGRGSSMQVIASLSSEAVVSLQHILEPSDDPEVTAKQRCFESCDEFQMSTQLFMTLDAVADKLLAVEKPEDLENLARRQTSYKDRLVQRKRQLREGRFDVSRALQELGISDAQEDFLRDMEAEHKQQMIEQMIKSNQEEAEAEQDELMRHLAEIERLNQPSSDLQVEFSLDGQLLENWTSLFSLAPRGEEQLKLGFKFLNKQLCCSAAYVDADDCFRHCIAEASDVGLPCTSEVYPVLRLIKLLYLFNASINLNIPQESFFSSKLSGLISRQSDDAAMMLTDTCPEWISSLLRSCQFLFPFELRLNVLRRTNFTGLSIRQLLSAYRRTQIDPVNKRKFTIHRTDLLGEALRIFSEPRTVRHNILEFDYAGEEGTGLGPTLEFYYMLSKELRMLKVWRNSGEETGLFPAPDSKEDLGFWESLGRMVGKALADDKLLELPLSPVLWKLIFRKPVQFNDLAQVDPTLASHLTELLGVSRHSAEVPALYRGSSIESLHMTFTVPGYDSIELKPDGSQTSVTAENLAEFVDLAAMVTLFQTPQAEAIRLGMYSVIDLSKLEYLTCSELETVLCGSNDEDWEQSVLQEALVAAHGYTKASETILNLVSVMQDFTAHQRRLFLSFITGSPRLPIGGFKAISPPLTVVRKDPTLPGGSPDQYMPSVMTCQNYLKLPDYSSAAVLKKNLIYAMEEGRETFHFS
jgi:hypothetical protein